MGNPLEQYLTPPEKKKKKSGNPLEALLGEESSDEMETKYLGFVRGEGREGVLGTAEDFGRGVLTTAVTGLPGLVEAGAGLASKIPVVGGVAEGTKEWLKKYREEAMAEIDPQGIAGGVGQLAGIVLPGGVGGAYGKLYSKSGKIIESLPKVGSAAAKIAAKAAEKSTGTLAEKAVGLAKRAPARAATSAIRGAPINVGIAVGMSDDPEAMKKEIAIGIVGDLLFGTIDRGVYGPKPKATPDKPITAESLPKADAPTENLPPDRLIELEEIKKKGAEKKAAKEAKLTLRRIVSGRYQGETGKLFKDLPKTEQQKLTEQFIRENPEHPAVKGVPIVEPASTPAVDAQAGVVAATVTPRVEAKVAEVIEKNPDATPEEIKAEVAKLPEVKRALEEPRITERQQVDDGGSEVKHLIDINTTQGPFRAIIYVARDGESARVDWFGSSEKPEVKLGQSEIRRIFGVLRGEFPNVKNVNYDRMGGTHGNLPEAQRQKSKTLEAVGGEGSLAGQEGAPAGVVGEPPLAGVSDTGLDTSIGSTEAHAKEIDELQDELAKRGAFQPDPDEPGRSIEDYNAFLKEVRAVQALNLPHEQHMERLMDIVDDFTPLSKEEIDEVRQMEEAMARPVEEEPTPLSPEEEAQLLAETQELLPPEIGSGPRVEDLEARRQELHSQLFGKDKPDVDRNDPRLRELQEVQSQLSRKRQDDLIAQHVTPEFTQSLKNMTEDELNLASSERMAINDRLSHEPEEIKNKALAEVYVISRELNARHDANPNRKAAEELLDLADVFTAKATEMRESGNEAGYSQVLSAGMYLTDVYKRMIKGEILSPDELANIQKLRDFASTDQAPPEQGTLTQDITETPLAADAPGLGGEAPPPPVAEVRLESAPGDISKMSEKKRSKLETDLLKIASDETQPQAKRDMAERDLNRIFEWQREQNRLNPPEPLNLPPVTEPQAPPVTTAAFGAEIVPATPIPEKPVVKTKVKGGVEGQTYLATTDLSKPLEEMSVKDREKLIDKLRTKINALDPVINGEKVAALQNDLDTVLEIQGGGVAGGGSVAARAAIESQKQARQVAEAVGGEEDLPAAVFQKLFKGNLRTMNIDDLKSLVRGLTYKIDGNPDPDAVKLYTQKLHKAMEEVSIRAKDSSGPSVQMPPGVGGSALGFLAGYYSAEDDETRVSNAFMWAAVGGVGGMIGGRLVRRGGAPKVDRTPSELPGGDWQAQVGQHIVSSDVTQGREVPFLERMRKIYFETIRRSYIGERFLASIGAEGLRTVNNPARLMEMFGRWTAQTEAALRSGPSLFDEFGNERHLGAPGAHEILKDVNGDVETLGTLMAVRTVIEHGGTIKVPFDMVAAVNAFHRIPEQFHRAADKARKLSLAMVEVLTDGGIISRDKMAEFSDEKWYAALERVFKFDPDMGGPAAEKGQNLSVGAQNPFKTRKKGSKDAIKNPFKTLIESIPRFYRAAELNKIKTSFVDAWEAAGKPEEWMQLVSGKEAGEYDLHLKKVDELKAELKGLSDDNAHALVAAFDPNAVNVEKGTMRIYRNGKIQNYRIHADLARALLSLNPDEMHWAVRMMGAPARVASTGVVLNPFFVAKMGFFDAFQATINSKYGFRPGYDNVRGWWNIVTRSKKYQSLLSVGLSHQSLAGANVENIKTTFEALERTTGTPIDVAFRHLKEARPLEFYKALVAPIADAARVGEALRALDHGASTLDAVYAAKTVTGNYQERGAWAGMRGLQHMTMFLGPALQVLDTAAYRGGVHPFRKSEAGRLKDFSNYAWKSFVTIGLPSMYFWAAADGDEEIKQLRTADAGRKWWFMRLPWNVDGYGEKGQIIRIPKPILDGQLMGTTVETVLDAMYDKDPVQAGELAKSIAKDAMFNLAPTIGVIPYSLQAGQDLSRGFELYPTWERQLDVEHRGENSASFMSRMLSKKIAPTIQENVPLKAIQNAVSPAGLDYLANALGGMLGRDALVLASQAVEYDQKGYVPAMKELPIIREVLVTTPSLRTRDIQQFYRHADEFERANTTFNHWLKEDIEKAVPYFEANIDKITNAKMFDTIRGQLANYRRAIADVKAMDASMISSEDRRKLIAEYTTMMLDMAKMGNELIAQ
jgi:hypothetical protein